MGNRTMIEQDSTTINQEGREQSMNGAALINEQGQEIPITEEMIRAALEDLELDKFQTAYSASQLNFSTH